MQRQLGDDRGIVVIDLPGRKQTRYLQPFKSMVGGDVYQALYDYIRNHELGPGIFNSYYSIPVNYTNVYNLWVRKLVKLGLVPEERGRSDLTWRSGYNMHEMRDLFRTRWHKSDADPLVAEFMMGHEIDPLGYNKAMNDTDYLVREYRKALPYLNIISEDPEKISIYDHKQALDTLQEANELKMKAFEGRLQRLERRRRSE